MASEFVIQSGSPRTEVTRDPDDASLSDAIQSVFPMRTERMILTWNGVYVPLGYKYDFSFMVDDIVDLAKAILNSSGHQKIHWPSNSFAAVWDIQWDSECIVVDAQWDHVVGGTEALLAASGSISIPPMEFLAEWKRPLEIVARALLGAGYTQEQVPRLTELNSVIGKLKIRGQLYGDQ